MNYDIVKKAPLRMKTDMYENIMNKAIESKLRGFIMIRIDIWAVKDSARIMMLMRNAG